jgi:hypothetical protein
MIGSDYFVVRTASLEEVEARLRPRGIVGVLEWRGGTDGAPFGRADGDDWCAIVAPDVQELAPPIGIAAIAEPWPGLPAADDDGRVTFGQRRTMYRRDLFAELRALFPVVGQLRTESVDGGAFTVRVADVTGELLLTVDVDAKPSEMDVERMAHVLNQPPAVLGAALTYRPDAGAHWCSAVGWPWVPGADRGRMVSGLDDLRARGGVVRITVFLD